MKKMKFMAAFFAVLSMAFFVACDSPTAPVGPGTGGEKPDPELGDTINVASLLEMTVPASGAGTQKYLVKGYIVGTYNFDADPKFVIGTDNAVNTNLLLADDPENTDTYKVVSVKLAVGAFRAALNLLDNAANYKKELIIYGVAEKYCGINGIVNIEKAYLDGVEIIVKTDDGTGTGTEADPYDVAAATANQTGSAYVKGYIVGYYNFNASPAFVIGAENAVNTSILIANSPEHTSTSTGLVAVQLPAGTIRDALNLLNNPSNYQAEVVVYGSLEKYTGIAGVKNTSFAKLNGNEYGTRPVDTSDAILSETLLSKESYDKFTAVSVLGDQVWTHSTTFGAMCTGYTDKSYANEDWFISPVVDLSGKTDVTLSFEHARGPEASITVGLEEGWYKVYVTGNYTGDVATTTWVELNGVVHGTTKWGFVNSGNLAIPSSALTSTMRFAFRYECSDSASATWEIKNVVIK